MASLLSSISKSWLIVISFSIIMIGGTKYKPKDHIALRIGKIYTKENHLKYANFFDLGFCTGSGKELFKSNTIANSIFGIFYVESRMVIEFNKNSEKIKFCKGKLKFNEILEFIDPYKDLYYDIVIDGIQKTSKIATIIEKNIIHVNTLKNIEVFVNRDEIVNYNIQDNLLYPIYPDNVDVEFMYSIKFSETKAKRYVPLEKIHDNSIKYTFGSLLIIYLISYWCFRKRILKRLHILSTLDKIDYNEKNGPDPNFLISKGDLILIPPPFPLLLASLVGTGIQVMVTYFIASCFSVFINFSSSESVFGLFKDILISFSLSSILNGYVSSNVYSFFNGRNYYCQIIISSLILPIIFLSSFGAIASNFVENDMLYLVQPINFIAFVIYYLLLVLPLNFIGSYWVIKNKKEFYRTLNYHNLSSNKTKYPQINCWRILLLITYHSFTLTPLLFQIYFIYKTKWLDSYLNVNIGLRLLAIMIIVSALMMLISLVYGYTIIESGRYLWQWESFYFGSSIFISLQIFSLVFMKKNLIGFADKLTIRYFLFTSFVWTLSLSIYSGALSFLSSLFIVRLIKNI